MTQTLQYRYPRYFSKMFQTTYQMPKQKIANKSSCTAISSRSRRIGGSAVLMAPRPTLI